MRRITPLRYPGGKAKIYNKVSKILEDNFENNNIHYIEPFAGGAGLALKLLYNDKVSSIHLNDYDYSIYILWKIILNQPKKLINKVKKAIFTIEEWKKQKNTYITFKKGKKVKEIELAYCVLYLNRCNRSGIITGGVIGGMKQEGNYKMDCRFNKDTLCNQIQWISDNRDRITVTNYDAKSFLLERFPDNSFINIDPPYVEKGKQLYLNYFLEQDHIDIFNSVNQIINKWMITYDDTIFIRNLYTSFRQDDLEIQYTVAKKVKKTERIIYSNNLNI